MPLNFWHVAFDNKTVAEASMDRIVHDSHYMEFPLSRCAEPGIRTQRPPECTPATNTLVSMTPGITRPTIANVRDGRWSALRLTCRGTKGPDLIPHVSNSLFRSTYAKN